MEQDTTKEVSEKKGRRVFLSVLGASFYDCYTYSKGTFRSRKTKFVQCASLEYFISRGDFGFGDPVYIFHTELARDNNWEVTGNQRPRKKDAPAETYYGLEYELKQLGFAGNSLHGITIPDGNTEGEIWGIFSDIYKELREDDEVYLDITHSFRYIPMLVMVLLDYAKFLLHIKIRGIIYGKLNNDGSAQLVDLLPLSDLQDWTSAADQYISSGSSEKLIGICRPVVDRIRKDAVMATGADGHGFRPDSSPVVTACNHINSFLHNVDRFCKDQMTCFGDGVVSGETARKVRENLRLVQDEIRPLEEGSTDTMSLPEPLKPLLVKIGEASEEYGLGSVRNLFISARACYGHKQYQQALTFLKEGIISFLCEKFHLDATKKKERAWASEGFNKSQGHKAGGWEKSGWDDGNAEDARRHEDVVSQMVNSQAVKAICKDARNINDLRNQYMHCGLLRERKDGKDDKKAVPDRMLDQIKKLIDNLSYEKLEGYFEQLGDGSTADQVTSPAGEGCEEREDAVTSTGTDEANGKNCTTVFINFTNHPSAGWGERQKEEAMALGRIVDLTFPAVPTDADPEKLDMMVGEYMGRIDELRNGQACVVHIQGEMTFTFRMVTALKARHICCKSSVTERNTVDLGGGKSQSVFVFAGFRDY